MTNGHVIPEVPTLYTTKETLAARLRYVDAWAEWVARPTLSNAITRDNVRNHYYAMIGREACGVDGRRDK